MALQIQLRRDDAATWTTVNPILAEGELGIETDTAKAKIGDGVTHWASLAYYGVGLTEPEVQALIDDEAVLREAADATLAGDVTAEATTRASADTALGGRLTTVETALPLKADLVAGTVPDAQIPASIARDSEVTAAIAALVASSPTTLDTLNELAAALGDDPNFATTITTALGGKQPLDSDLTAIAALTTTTFGRGLLTLADAAALRVAAALGSAATAATTDFDAAGAAAAAQAASQPLDSDLTAIAALSTTTFGRSLLALADAAAGRTALGLGSAATVATTAFDAAGAAATEQTRAQAAEALLAPLASPTFTGTLVVPSAKISGKNGLSPRTFTGRSTTTGAPTTGTWAVDDVVRDSAGVDWRCTVAGTPGTWVTDSGSYVPLAGSFSSFVGGALATLAGAKYIPHRCGGQVAPEDCDWSAEAMLTAGASIIDIDCVTTNDGGVVVSHDSTLDRVFSATGTISAVSTPFFKSLFVVGNRYGPAYPNIQANVLEDFLDRWGGKVLLSIEGKNSTAQAQILARVAARGLGQYVLVNCSTWADAQTSIAAGCRTLLWQDSTNVDSSQFAAYAAGGLDVLVLRGDDSNVVSDANITAAVAAGLRVWCDGILHRAKRDHVLGLGVTGIVSDEYVYTRSNTTRATTATFPQGVWGPGYIAGTTTRASIVGDTLGSCQLRLAATADQSLLLGELCPIANKAATYTITLGVVWTALPTSASDYLVVNFARDTDDAYPVTSSDTRPSYNAILQKDGTLRVERVTGGVRTVIGTVATTALTTGATFNLVIAVTATTITVSRSDTAETTGAITDSTYRGGYVYVGKSGADGEVRLSSAVIS